MAIFGIKENKSLVDVKAGAGISLGSDGATVGHSNSVTPKTSMIGSATAIPRIKYDAQGHITGTDTVTVYPPTDPGQSGQVWTSDGVGTGKWAKGSAMFSVMKCSMMTDVDDEYLHENKTYDFRVVKSLGYLHFSSSESSGLKRNINSYIEWTEKGLMSVSVQLNLDRDEGGDTDRPILVEIIESAGGAYVGRFEWTPRKDDVFISNQFTTGWFIADAGTLNIKVTNTDNPSIYVRSVEAWVSHIEI